MRDDLEEIRKATERAAVLTSRLLAFSRRQVLFLQVMDLGAVVRGMGEMLRRLLGSHIELEVGLAMAYGVVKQSHGYIWVESAPGRGATFRIYLPLLELEDVGDGGSGAGHRSDPPGAAGA
jgi:signal transduction histidine kinase